MKELTAFNTLFVGLDALFDTRMATLWTFGEPILQRALTAGYYTRVHDRFPGLSEAEYFSKYAARDNQILESAAAAALFTPVLNLITSFVATVNSQNQHSPTPAPPRILVATHPYSPSEELGRGIVRGLVEHTAGKADIGLTPIQPEELTPRFVRDELSLLILYDYLDWAEYHCETKAFLHTNCPDVGLIVPRVWPKLYQKPVTPPTIKADGPDPFSALEQALEIFIKVAHQPIELFSAALRPVYQAPRPDSEAAG